MLASELIHQLILTTNTDDSDPRVFIRGSDGQWHEIVSVMLENGCLVLEKDHREEK